MDAGSSPIAGLKTIADFQIREAAPCTAAAVLRAADQKGLWRISATGAQRFIPAD